MIDTDTQRDHGGNLDEAIQHYGGSDWIDLSTGINRTPWPIPDLPPTCWKDLPTRTDQHRLLQAARTAYQTTAPGLALAGAQSAIQLVPQLSEPGTARIIGPTYNEHAASLKANGWEVKIVHRLEALAGAQLAVVVNPNNPGGQHYPADQLLQLHQQVGTLVVDESFGDACPELSLAPHANQKGLVILRSFGKFYGLAGLRLGFMFADETTISRAADLCGPWPVSGIAIEVGTQALLDSSWKNNMIRQLRGDAARLDNLAENCKWRLDGGTELFRTYTTPNAKEVRESLANAQIWTRIFPWSDQVIRVGLPGNESEWNRLATAMGVLNR
ncbi:MAG: threonine-phosphate decarboxylase CobD [Pseudomonadota bacterium]